MHSVTVSPAISCAVPLQWLYTRTSPLSLVSSDDNFCPYAIDIISMYRWSCHCTALKYSSVTIFPAECNQTNVKYCEDGLFMNFAFVITSYNHNNTDLLPACTCLSIVMFESCWTFWMSDKQRTPCIYDI